LVVGVLASWLLKRHPAGSVLERAVMDEWTLLRGGLPVRDVVIVGVDEATQRAWNGRDFDAPKMARLLRLLKRAETRGVLLVFPDLPQQAAAFDSRSLRQAVSEHGAVYVGVDMSGRHEGEPPVKTLAEGELARLRPLPSAMRRLVQVAAGRGHLSLQTDGGGCARAVPFREEGRGQAWRALAMAPFSAEQLNTMLSGPQERRLALLNYPHESPDPQYTYTRSPFPRVSVLNALQTPDALKPLRGKWIVIGPDTRAAQDYDTPLGGRVSLAEVQAVALDNLVSGRAARPAPNSWRWLLVLLPCAVVGGLSSARRPVWSLTVALLCACGAAFLSFAAWNANVWLDVVAPWLGIGMTFFVGAFARARWQERQATRIASIIEALTQASELTAAQKQPSELLPRVLSLAEDALRAQSAALLLLDSDGQTLRFACATGPKATELQSVTLRVGEGIAGWVVQEGQPAVVNEAFCDWRFNGEVDKRVGTSTRSVLAVPMKGRDRMLGVLEVVNRRDDQPFDTMDAELLSAIANQAALVLENAHLYERLNERVEASESELARANSRLQSEKTLLQTVLQSMTDGVVVTDRRGRVQLMNQAASALLPELGPQVLGRALTDAVPELRALVESGGAEAQRSGEGLNGHSSPHLSRSSAPPLLLRGDVDAPRIIEAHTAPLLTGPAPGGGQVAVFSDVTEQRNVERAKSDFVSFVAHEMRSPLTSISGFSSMLLRLDERGDQTASRSRFLSIIHDESERLTRLINNLLDVARIEAGRGVELNREELEVLPLLEAAAESQRSYSTRHRVVVEVDDSLMQPSADSPSSICNPQLIYADRDKTLQVLINLLSNALKYSPGGTVTLRAQSDGDGDGVRFCVCDQGPGISPEDRASIFGRFERGARAHNVPVGGAGQRAKPTGTGLGLFLSKYLIEAHGGRIWVESEAGHGATFCFTLPAAPAPTNEESEQAQEALPL
jgi:two-component system phosphate regulon sensor histidine kinase PhoR